MNRAADDADAISKRIAELAAERTAWARCTCTTGADGERVPALGCPEHPSNEPAVGAFAEGRQKAALMAWAKRKAAAAACTCTEVSDDYNGRYRVWARGCPEHSR